ncbi:MAG: 50S ribosomal protein L31 [Firmicutes bacterium]|nr:50S ribosomal protein L31 [Bacillota bacterium]
MKEGIHPKMHKVTVHCACGASFETASTKSDNLRVEVCSQCHPLYTGTRAQIVERGGRIERFRKKYGYEG